MSTLGQHCSDETKAKISATEKGKSPPNKGIPMTEEQRAKCSVAHMGKQIGHPHYGPKYHTAETKAKMSAAKMGHIESEETCAKISIAHMGSKMSPESRVKNATAHWKGGPRVNWAKTKARRRALGFNPLNSPFPGSEAHHINNDDVIHIPRKLHCSVWHNQQSGQGMAQMNALAGQYLTEDWT